MFSSLMESRTILSLEGERHLESAVKVVMKILRYFHKEDWVVSSGQLTVDELQRLHSNYLTEIRSLSEIMKVLGLDLDGSTAALGQSESLDESTDIQELKKVRDQLQQEAADKNVKLKSLIDSLQQLDSVIQFCLTPSEKTD
eukprot:GILK01014764.1.p1 GENE.GILK01014764.1~~GILK01014764.1.p1  ORF type:complete len:142 (+),score=31.27 GILK01014764.1:24-449(+)